VQLSEDELRRPINGHEEVELALLSANPGNVEVRPAPIEWSGGDVSLGMGAVPA
jgi:hypothetical protein